MSALMLLRRRTALRVQHTRTLLGSTGAVALLLLAVAGVAAWWTPHVVDDTNLLHLQTAAETRRARSRMLDLPPDPATQMSLCLIARTSPYERQANNHAEIGTASGQ